MRKGGVAAVQHLEHRLLQSLRAPDIRRFAQSGEEAGCQLDGRVTGDAPIADQKRARSGAEKCARQTRETIGKRSAVRRCRIARREDYEIGIDLQGSNITSARNDTP